MKNKIIELQADFLNHKNSCDTFENQTKHQIKYFMISKGFLLNIRDFENETFGFKKGKELSKLPTKLKNIHIYNFNSENQIIQIDKYGDNSSIIDREFNFYNKNGIKSFYYSGGFIRLRNVCLSTQINNKTDEVLIYGAIGLTLKKYIYNSEGILKKIKVKSKEHEKKEFDEHELQFEFDDNNSLIQIIQTYPNGFSKTIYNPLS